VQARLFLAPPPALCQTVSRRAPWIACALIRMTSLPKMGHRSPPTASRPLRIGAAALCALGIAFAPAAAQAQSNPTSAQYKPAANQVSVEVEGGPEETGLQKEVVSGLPFTGLDLIALLAVAIAMTSIGFALRRLTSDRGKIS
jgi:hypothetical protein